STRFSTQGNGAARIRNGTSESRTSLFPQITRLPRSAITQEHSTRTLPSPTTGCRRDDAGAGRAAATADGDDDHLDPWLLLEDRERLRGDAGDEQRLVAGVHVAVTALVGEPLATLARLVVVAPVKDELGAEAAHRGDLDGVRRLGDADRR